MSAKTGELHSHLYDYLLSVSLREPEHLVQLRQETAQHPFLVHHSHPAQLSTNRTSKSRCAKKNLWLTKKIHS